MTDPAFYESESGHAVSRDWAERWPEDFPDATTYFAEHPIEEPPRHGPHATTEAWAAYAQDVVGIEVPPGVDRDEIIRTVEAAKEPAALTSPVNVVNPDDDAE